MKEESTVNFLALEERVFHKRGEEVYIGGNKIDEITRSLLKDQAFLFQNSNLYEILDATVTNEAVNLLLQATTVEHLQYAKALYYWQKIMKKTVDGLSK